MWLAPVVSLPVELLCTIRLGWGFVKSCQINIYDLSNHCVYVNELVHSQRNSNGLIIAGKFNINNYTKSLFPQYRLVKILNDSYY